MIDPYSTPVVSVGRTESFPLPGDVETPPNAVVPQAPEPVADTVPRRVTGRAASRIDTSDAGTVRLVRRALTKHSELLAASAHQLDIAAALLGSKRDPAELTIAIVTGARVKTHAATQISELVELAAAAPGEAMFYAAGLDRDAAKSVWSILAALGVATGNLPARDRDAAKSLVNAAAEVTDEHLAELDVARSLARK